MGELTIDTIIRMVLVVLVIALVIAAIYFFGNQILEFFRNLF